MDERLVMKTFILVFCPERGLMKNLWKLTRLRKDRCWIPPPSSSVSTDQSNDCKRGLLLTCWPLWLTYLCTYLLSLLSNTSFLIIVGHSAPFQVWKGFRAYLLTTFQLKYSLSGPWINQMIVKWIWQLTCWPLDHCLPKVAQERIRRVQGRTWWLFIQLRLKNYLCLARRLVWAMAWVCRSVWQQSMMGKRMNFRFLMMLILWKPVNKLMG